VPPAPRSQAVWLWALVALTALATLQRAALIWKPAQAIRPLPAHPASVELALLLTQPPRVTADVYQQAVLVRRQAPSWSLVQRQLVHTPAGTVAMGVLANGVPSLQTCLMATGRAAVTFEQMRAQVLRTGPARGPQTLRAASAAVLLGRPLRQRGCLLVLLRSRSAGSKADPGGAQQQRQLLQTWTSLQPSLQPLRPR